MIVTLNVGWQILPWVRTGVGKISHLDSTADVQDKDEKKKLLLTSVNTELAAKTSIKCIVREMGSG